jgi:hypothetical protein
MVGELIFGDDHFHFGSGGVGASIPYGVYPITPNAVGHWGAAHKAIGINNGEIWDEALHRNREGIEIHGLNHLATEGCVALSYEEYKKLRRKILDCVADGKHLYMHVTSNGIEINEHS